jgi:hypothetical protein
VLFLAQSGNKADWVGVKATKEAVDRATDESCINTMNAIITIMVDCFIVALLCCDKVL